MKTLTSATQTHLQGDVTTLAVCWRITRKDGVIHRFTDHDESVMFLSNHSITVPITAGEKYIALGSFSRTAIAIKQGLKVDNLDLTGLVNADAELGGIHISDIQSGRFRLAEVSVFMCDWTTPDDGVIPILRGNIGAIKLNQDSKTYEAELRGLSQKFSQKIGEVYTFLCRADLFDSRCGLLRSNFVQRSFVETTSDNRTFVVPADITIPADPSQSSGAPDLGDGDMIGIVEEPNGTLRLKRGPDELGTAGAPFLVSTPAELNAIRTNPLAWYALTTDIDMSGFGFWTPISTFKGGIDGRGYEIQNLDVDRTTHAQPVGPAAFIDQLHHGSMIRRLGIRNGIFDTSGSASHECAPLVASFASSGTGTTANGIIEDCWSYSNRIYQRYSASPGYESGLVGDIRELGSVRRCVASNIFIKTVDRDYGAKTGGLIAATGLGSTAIVAQDDDYVDSEAQEGILSIFLGGSNEILVVPPDTSGVAGVTADQIANYKTFSNFDFQRKWVTPEEDGQGLYVDTGGETITFTSAALGSARTIVRSAGSWITDGFRPGTRIRIAGVSDTTTVDLSTAGSITFVGASGATLPRVVRGTGSWITDGIAAGMQITFVGTRYPVANGRTYTVHDIVTAGNMRLAPGSVWGSSSLAAGSPTIGSISVNGSNGDKNVIAVTATTLTLDEGPSGVGSFGPVAATGISIIELGRPRGRGVVI